MEFRVLGPLEVEDGGQTVPLGGPAEQHLLAVLLCLANEVVPVERLIDELWGEEPPVTSRNMVQRYVSRLRGSLGDTDSTRLATEAGGYRLHVDDEELDWCRFETLVIRARDLEDLDAATVLLQEALGMRRGPPLAGAGDGPTVTAERIRLEEAYLAALEERIDQDLGLGCHHELVSELEGLCGQHPLRERFRAQLMVALYRCGRQADALRSYAEYREHVGEETGLDPSPALAELETRILVRSPDLDLPPPGPALPHTNLPHRLTTFVGRRREIDAVIRQVNENRLVTLTGTGGIGKTALAVEAAAELVDVFDDGAWLIDLAPLSEPTLLSGTTAGVLGVRTAFGEDTVDALCRHLAERRSLIILDNCEHLISEAARFVETLLKSSPNLRVLATSREPLSAAGEAIMRVPPLNVPDSAQSDAGAIAESEAVMLFTDRARLLKSGFGIDAGNAADVAEICRRLDGIPLAIELAAARLGTMGLHKIAESVEDRYLLLTRGARTAPHRHQTLRALVDWSHDLLTDHERILFRRLAVFAGSFTGESAQQVCGFDPLTHASVLVMLEQLVDASLVVFPDPEIDRFRMLQTIREYAYRRLNDCEKADDTMLRLATYLIEAGPDTEDGYPRLDAVAWYRWRHDEQDNFRAVLAWSIEVGNADVASEAAIEFRGYLSERQLTDEALAWTNAALALLGDEPSHRRLLLEFFGIATEAFLGERMPTLTEARSLHSEAQALGDDGMMGQARRLEAVLAYRLGDTATALALNAEAIGHFRTAADPLVIESLWLRAFHLARLGRYEESRVAAKGIVAETALLGVHGDPRFATYSSNVLQAMIAMHVGDLASAEELLDAESGYAHRFGAGELYLFLVVRSFLALAHGDAAAAGVAAAELSGAVPETAPPGILRDAAMLRAVSALDTAGFETALPDLCEALEYAHRDASVIDSADVVRFVAEVALASGDHEAAVKLDAASSAIYEGSAVVLTEWERRRLSRSREALRRVLGDARFDSLWADGATLSPAEMMDCAVRYADTVRPSSL